MSGGNRAHVTGVQFTTTLPPGIWTCGTVAPRTCPRFDIPLTKCSGNMLHMTTTGPTLTQRSSPPEIAVGSDLSTRRPTCAR